MHHEIPSFGSFENPVSSCRIFQTKPFPGALGPSEHCSPLLIDLSLEAPGMGVCLESTHYTTLGQVDS